MNAALQKYLRRTIRVGALEIVDSGGKVHRFGDGHGAPVRVRFTSAAALRAVFIDPDLKLGEEFSHGGYVLEAGSICHFLLIVFANADNARLPWRTIALAALRTTTKHLRQFNTPLRARRDAHAHYDLDGRLYSHFLDDDLQYSCAYFEEGAMSLDDAQLAKKRHLAAKLALKPGQRVLDIGSGWGGLGLYLAEHAGVDVTGVTLSDEQLAVSNRRAAERGLSDRVRFSLGDYRQLSGTFDRIVSVGMFEHVGVRLYRAFFSKCYDLLAPDGVMLLHTIGRVSGPGDTSAWLQRYIFPGGYIPALSELMPRELMPRVEKSGLQVTDVEILRTHYAKTLRLWRERFLEHRQEVAALYDERFRRMWEFYLAAAEAAFRVGALVNFQIQIAKNQEALPITRAYMGNAEKALRRADGKAVDRRPLKLAGE